MITAIVAMDTNRGIATNLGIPWNIPQDRRYFKQKTINNTVVMGYKTYQSIGTPLEQRKNIVLTSHSHLSKGFIVARNVGEILKIAGDNLFVIGGQEVYEAFLSYTEKLVITQIDGDFTCTRFFPDFVKQFKLTYKSRQYYCGDLGYHYEHWYRMS